MCVKCDNRSTNDMLRAAGIKTTHTLTKAYLHRNGITIERPNVNNAIKVCLAVFGVVIGGDYEESNFTCSRE